MTTIARPTGLSRFRYNGGGQRVERVQAGGTTRYLYNGDNVILTTNGTAPFTVQEYITPGVGLFKVGQSVVNPGPLSATAAAGAAAAVPGQMIFNQENALGSTISTRNADGSLGGMWEYDAYGSEKSRAASGLTVDARTDFRFAGKHGYISDPDTGFDLLGARYYIPRLGRFLTQDPIGHAGGLNLYAYCENSPLSKVDPDGKDAYCIFGRGPEFEGSHVNAFRSRSLIGAGSNSRVHGFGNSNEFFGALHGMNDVTRLDIHSHGSLGGIHTGTVGDRIGSRQQLMLLASFIAQSGRFSKSAQIRIFACNSEQLAMQLSKFLGEAGMPGMTVSGAYGYCAPDGGTPESYGRATLTDHGSRNRELAGKQLGFKSYRNGKQVGGLKSRMYYRG